MKKWYNYETENPIIKDELRSYLKRNKLRYELSGCYDGWHFEIELSEDEAAKTIWFLDSIYDVYNF